MDPFRLTPNGPAHAYKTYTMLRPVDTHTRTVTCVVVGCEQQENGWITTLDETTPLGQKQAHYIRTQSGRHYIESDDPGAPTLFTFPPGQECFTTHNVALDRDSTWIVRGGDWRGNPRGTSRVHDTGDNWVEDFAEHQDKLSRAQE